MVTRVCSKLSFVEVGSSAVAGAAAPARTLSAGPSRHQLSRTSTSVSSVSSYARCSSMGDRRQSVPAGKGSARGAEVGSKQAGKVKAQVGWCAVAVGTAEFDMHSEGSVQETLTHGVLL